MTERTSKEFHEKTASPEEPKSCGQPDRPAPLWTRLLWGVVLIVALTWYCKARVIEIVRYVPFYSSFHGNDFIHLYSGSWLIVKGRNPYDAMELFRAAVESGFSRSDGRMRLHPYVYLPFTGVAMSPLILLSPENALRVWCGLNHLFFIVSFVLMFRAFDLKPTLRNVAMAAMIATLCFPFHRTLTAGQLNCVLLLLLVLVYSFDRKSRGFAAGAAAAFAFLFKLIPGILILYFAWRALTSAGKFQKDGRKKWNGFLGMIAFTILFLAATIGTVGIAARAGDGLYAGFRQHLAFNSILRHMGYGRSTWEGFGRTYYRDPTNQSFNSFLHHTMMGSESISPWVSFQDSDEWANNITVFLTIACILIALWRLWPWKALWRSEGASPSVNLAAFNSILLLGLLIPSICWDHYATIMLFPLLAYHARLSEGQRTLSFASSVVLVLLFGGYWHFDGVAAILHFENPNIFFAFVTTVRVLLSIAAVALLLTTLLRRRGIRACLWSIAAACLLARFAFDDNPALYQGWGLIALSLRLWGLLILWGLWLAECSVKAKPSCCRCGGDA